MMKLLRDCLHCGQICYVYVYMLFVAHLNVLIMTTLHVHSINKIKISEFPGISLDLDAALARAMWKDVVRQREMKAGHSVPHYDYVENDNDDDRVMNDGDDDKNEDEDIDNDNDNDDDRVMNDGDNDNNEDGDNDNDNDNDDDMILL